MRAALAALVMVALLPLTGRAASGVVPESTVILHFVDPSEIKRMVAPTNSVAVTYPSRHPCEVFLPTGMWLWGDEKNYPYRGMFVWSRDADLVAHEILHCVIGGWHYQPPVSANAAGR
jgi:hypothetical protein